jgi:LacI family transcriptional regulator, repressor for deo operon, udp, cdd, tsx, nupC, and nupG
MAKVGIKDIAQKAGVSIATVSHALRNPGRVSEATREKVLAAVKEVGYTPNQMGVSLRTAKSGSIVAIIPDVSDTFNFGVIKAIEEVAFNRGYSVLLGDTQGSEKRERKYASMVQSRQADGIILFSNRLPFDISDDKPAFEQIPPLINSCELVSGVELPTVTIDDKQAAIDATNHLIDYGHTDIAVITGNMDHPSSQRRLEGFKQAMEQANLPINSKYIALGDYTIQCGETGTRQLLVNKTRPTAIFCFCDETALGCISTLRTQGFEVPNDISVMGFDDIRFSRHFSPPLTTIAQPVEQIGEMCATLLLDLIDGKKPEKFENILPHRLVIRESTKRL